jgi:hypothetical protein
VVVEDGPTGGGVDRRRLKEVAAGSSRLPMTTSRSPRLCSRAALTVECGVLTWPSMTVMTSDHLSPAQRVVSGFWPGYFDTTGWGFEMSVLTGRTHLEPSVGCGWPGRYGTATSV